MVETQVGGVAADRLRSLIERIERLEEEKAGIASDIRDIFAEAKGAGQEEVAVIAPPVGYAGTGMEVGVEAAGGLFGSHESPEAVQVEEADGVFQLVDGGQPHVVAFYVDTTCGEML